MAPAIAAALIAAVPAVIQGVSSISQANKARKLAEAERPDYSRPEEMDKLVANARRMAGMTELPQQDLLESKLRRGTAESVKRMETATDSPAAILGNLSKLQTSENQSMQDISSEAARFHIAQQAAYRNALAQAAGYGDKEWGYNMNDPYQNAQAMAAQKRNAAGQNMMGSAKTLSSLAAMAYMTQQGQQAQGQQSVANEASDTATEVANDLDFSGNDGIGGNDGSTGYVPPQNNITPTNQFGNQQFNYVPQNPTTYKNNNVANPQYGGGWGNKQGFTPNMAFELLMTQ